MIKGILTKSMIFLFVIGSFLELSAQSISYQKFKLTDSLQLKSNKFNLAPPKKNFLLVPLTGNYAPEEKERIMNPHNINNMKDFLIVGTMNGLINLFFEKKN